jgi:hypothetical protein
MEMTTQDACCSSCAVPTHQDDTALAIACTLGSSDFKDRVTGIRDLASRALRSSRRDDLRLELVYDASALIEVEDLVAKESDCCAFLVFDLRRDGDSVRLAISAPESVRMAADELFAHFVPEPARAAA